MVSLRSLTEIGDMDDAAFATAMGPLFGHAPHFLHRLAAARPFDSIAAMLVRARAIAREMPEEEQVELIDAQPRLGASDAPVGVTQGREVARGSASEPAVEAASELERSHAAAELYLLNEDYEARFGFRYCVAAPWRPRGVVLAEMREALGAEREAEVRRALDVILDLAADRYQSVLERRDDR